MYCPKCGKQVPDNAAFCSECGANLKNDATSNGRQVPNIGWILCIVVSAMSLLGAFAIADGSSYSFGGYYLSSLDQIARLIVAGIIVCFSSIGLVVGCIGLYIPVLKNSDKPDLTEQSKPKPDSGENKDA